MDIESGAYRLTSATGGGYCLTRKRDRATVFLSRVPSARALAYMSESRFDREAAAAMQSGAWT